MDNRLRAAGLTAFTFSMLGACSTAPPGAQYRSESAEALPSDDELAHDGQPTDVTVPDMFRSDDPSDAERGMGFAGAAGAGGAPITLFLNRAGGTYRAGADNAAAHTSSVLAYYGRSQVALPASGYTGASWTELVDCVKQQFEGINVVVTDDKPTGGAYTELVVANTWAGTALGITNGVGGIAPLGACRAVPQAVGFVFHKIYDQPGYGGIRGACEATAHEIGHTLSLSHERLASDLMSYAPTNPGKAFQVQASACGVSASAPEGCSCGGATQSSRQQLLRVVGASGGGGGGGGGGDATPPTVAVLSPAGGASVPGNANVEVSVDATDDTGVSDVRLVWQYTGATLACDGSIAGVTCVRSGSRYTWTLLVGSGTRSFYAYAKDAAGNTKATPVTTITATGTGAGAPDGEPPVVNVQLPSDGQSVARGSAIVFRASVSSGRALSDVRAVWSYPGGQLEYPMVVTGTPGVYQASTTVSTTASPGWRSVVIQAADDKGRRTVTAARDVYVP